MGFKKTHNKLLFYSENLSHFLLILNVINNLIISLIVWLIDKSWWGTCSKKWVGQTWGASQMHLQHPFTSFPGILWKIKSCALKIWTLLDGVTSMSAMLKLQCAEDGLQYVHLTSPQRVLLFHGCHINENSLGKYPSLRRLEFEEGGQLVLLLDSLFPGGRCYQDELRP